MVKKKKAAKKAGIRTDVALAEKLKVSPKTVSLLKTQDGLKKKPDGTHDLTAARKILKERQSRGAAGTTKSKENRRWDIEYRKWRAKNAEAQYRRSIGELVERSEVTHEQINRELEFKQALISIPSAVSPRLVGLGIREIQSILTEKIFEALRKLARKT